MTTTPFQLSSNLISSPAALGKPQMVKPWNSQQLSFSTIKAYKPLQSLPARASLQIPDAKEMPLCRSWLSFSPMSHASLP